MLFFGRDKESLVTFLWLSLEAKREGRKLRKENNLSQWMPWTRVRRHSLLSSLLLLSVLCRREKISENYLKLNRPFRPVNSSHLLVSRIPAFYFSELWFFFVIFHNFLSLLPKSREISQNSIMHESCLSVCQSVAPSFASSPDELPPLKYKIWGKL